jgi:hypothetical protein
MITGVHAMLNTPDADGLRDWFRDVIGLDSVDAGEGWLIFKLPPAELGIHPSEGSHEAELYLLCDDVSKTTAELSAKGVSSTPVQDLGWGLVTSLAMPGGGTLGLYEPKHPTAIEG